MKVKDFDYDLPQELIAQTPLKERTDSRLLVMDRMTGEMTHTVFQQITGYLKPGDCLVLNNTKVIPARLFGTRAETGAQVEVLLLKQVDGGADASADGDNRISESAEGSVSLHAECNAFRKDNAAAFKNECVWETLVKPGKKARPGTELIFGDGLLRGIVEEIVDDGNRLIRFSYDGIFEEILDQLGQMPLPPYITEKLEDKSRYQTVYAKYDGSAAAPTAGLHFTQALLDEIEAMGVTIANVTLHVGLGTFRPVKVEEVTDHHMHSEFYRVEETDAEKIRNAKAAGNRVIAVGTTSCRTLESVMQKYGEMRACSGWTDIFIYPGYEFQCIDGLITNFHLPQSTLLMLVSAFAGREHIMHAYEEAIQKRYRFFSFGDAMLIV